MRTPRHPLVIAIAALSCVTLGAAAIAAPTDIYNEPLAQALSGVKPNIMFVLDDSGSMDSQYLPDYIVSSNCRRSATSGAPSLSGTLTSCEFGDPPYNAHEFNRQYYNPNIYYQPSPAPGGVDQTSRIMNSANTNGWTQVPTDKYSKQNRDSLENSATQANLVTGYPDRVWCANPSDPIASCKINADYTYPTATYKYGVDGSNNPRYTTGAPYYYKIQNPQYCTNSKFTDCQATADATHTVVAPVKFCTDSTFSSCQAKRSGSFTYPYFAGQFTASHPASSATATITVGNSGSDVPVAVSSIVAGGVEILGTTVNATGGTNSSTERTNAATAIKNAINSHGSGYTASSSGGTVTVTAPQGSAYNGVALQALIQDGSVASKGTITLNVQTTSTTSARTITKITVGGYTIWTGSYTAPSGDSNAAASAMATQINSYINTTPWEFTATASANVITVSTPSTAGAVPNGLSIVVTTGNKITVNTTNMAGGVGGTNMPLTTGSFAGGADAVATSTWTNTTNFERVDIVPTVGGVAKTFPRADDRIDCVTSSTYCTYAEEMTNFANWYAYYRKRLQMAKSSAGRAFIPITDTMRVGFITINPTSSGAISSSRYLKVNSFVYDSVTDTGHKKDWYTKLYNITTNGSTPLREALSRVGRLYAGKTDGINSGFTSADNPVQYSCQPNFTILTTDGYWNGNGGSYLDGGAMGNEDNVDAGYSKRVDGAYDGGGNSASGTLADVAMYYYKTDLRPDLADTVFTTSKDKAQFQHMTTFTVSIGLSGLLDYEQNYESLSSGDFYAIKQGTMNWPVPAANAETALDDLWHTAVNGRGTFYTASNPQDFSNGLSDALTQMFARAGAGSAAATSNLQPTAGDNFAFTAEYETSTWRGNVVARTIDTSTGTVASRSLWSAADILDQRNYQERVIYTLDAADTTASATPGSGNRLKNLCWPSSTDDNCTDGSGLTSAEQAYFNPNQLAQYSGWGPVQKAAANGANLLAFLKGDRGNETTGASGASDLYRSRASMMGDVISAQPAYIKASTFNYDSATNPHYNDFKTATTTRRGTVYVAANDGMLHAFETDANNNPYYQTAGISTISLSDDTFVGNNNGNGVERWAYVPSILLPQIYKLAETPYVHRYFADGSPIIGDICVGHTASAPCDDVNKWKTILVAGLNSGGRGYYALDVTDPLNPKALWEFKVSSTCLSDAQANSGNYSSDCNLGLSYGNPLIVKRPSDDRWVVIVSSGYNNYNPGDGKGYLYILDAATGAILQRMSTGVGSGGTSASNYTDAAPSGLGKINGWATNAIENNVALAVYGGDLQGNVWRFDLDPTSPNYNTVFRLAQLTNDASQPQPITTKPELGEVTPYRIVLVGTGKYLGTSDPTNTSVQSIYALRDDSSTTPISIRSDLVQRLFNTISSTERTTQAATALDWNTRKGWYIDLPDSGERVNTDPQLQLGTLIIGSNVPSEDICQAGGYGWLNYFNFRTGTVAQSTKVGNAMIVGLSTIKLSNGTIHTIVTTADNQRTTVTPPVSTSGFADRRVSWREIISE